MRWPTMISSALERLMPDQDKDSCQQRQQASDNANSKSRESKNSDRDQINRQQKHADVFGHIHAVSICNCQCS